MEDRDQRVDSHFVGRCFAEMFLADIHFVGSIHLADYQSAGKKLLAGRVLPGGLLADTHRFDKILADLLFDRLIMSHNLFCVCV
mgnify:CR=1 FL=1